MHMNVHECTCVYLHVYIHACTLDVMQGFRTVPVQGTCNILVVVGFAYTGISGECLPTLFTVISLLHTSVYTSLCMNLCRNTCHMYATCIHVAQHIVELPEIFRG